MNELFKTAEYEIGYAQALGYSWGRADAGETYLGPSEISWAHHWAEARLNVKLPSIADEFRKWQQGEK